MPLIPKLSSAAALALSATLCVSSSFAQNKQHYTQSNLVANAPGMAAFTDANLVNPWGLSRATGGAWWVADNGTGLSTLYSGTGSIVPLVVTVPGALPGVSGTPTGTIFNGGTGFELVRGKPAVFLFSTEDGTISGWNPTLNAKSAVVMVNTKGDSIYKGMTMATMNDPTNGPQQFIYVADFRKAKVQVFNTFFRHVTEMENRFTDPELPSGYAPFNVQNIGGNIYVAFAAQGSGNHDEVDGAGLGYVDVFNAKGKLLLRFDHGTYLNAPWGLAQAPGDFGDFSHDILVGNFGSGEILAFNALTGKFKGTLNDKSDAPLKIAGLWGLSFGGGATSGLATTLYFAAGPGGESGGLLGSITAVENPQGNDR